MARQTSVMGIYPDRTTVSDAIKVLHKTGYRTTDVSVLASDNQGSKDFAHEKHTRARQGAAIGWSGRRRVGLVRFHSNLHHSGAATNRDEPPARQTAESVAQETRK